MTTERITLALAPGTTFADAPSRQISGIAVPANATAEKGGRVWRFLRNSVKFGQRTPLLAFHDVTRPVGKLTASQWTDEGLRCTFSVSRTQAGDEALALAADGVVGLSLGIDVPVGGARQVGEELHVSNALASEVSLTPIPAFAGSTIDHVALSGDHSGGTAMPEPSTNPDPTVTPAPTAVPPAPASAPAPGAPPLTVDAATLGQALAVALSAANPPAPPAGPTPQPVPNTAITTTAEPPPYRFDGQRGRFGFVADMREASTGSGEATQRLNTFLAETFAVSTADAAALNPNRQRPELYVPNLYRDRPLAGAITMGTLEDITPFTFPKFATSSGLVGVHTEGTAEPTPGAFTATSQTVEPIMLAGKAEINRALWDQGGNPQVDQLVWTEMLQASIEAAEERVAALLDGLTGLTEINVVGVDAAAVDDLIGALAALQYVRGGNRFRSLALAEDLYTVLVNAKDGDGRKLLPVLGPTNASGTTDEGFASVLVGNTRGVPTWGLAGDSYLFVPTSVYQWISTPQRLTFDIQIKSVYIGLIQYSAEAVTRDSDVRKVTYAAA